MAAKMKYEIVDNPAKLSIKCPQNLAKKIHLPEKSNCKYLFAVGKLGESAWKNALAKIRFCDFTFFDPHNYECPAEYNSFFDPHLQDYFRRRHIRNHLVKSCLITDKDEIVCSIKEFNIFRQQMNRLKAIGELEKLKRHTECPPERKRLNTWSEVHKKALNPLSYENVLKRMREKKSREEEERRKRRLKTLMRHSERVKKIDKMQELKRSQLRERGLYRSIESTKKRIYVLEKLRERRGDIKQRMYERERRLKREHYNYDPINYIIRCPVKI